MKKIVLMMVALMTLTLAQAKTQKKPTNQKKITHTEMTTQMTTKLKLSNAQKAKVAALNKEYELQLKKILTDDQYKDYQNMLPQK